MLRTLVAAGSLCAFAASCGRTEGPASPGRASETGTAGPSEATAPTPDSALGRRPNIVFILADDLGWRDVGYHGSEIRTPRIDELARSGVRLEALYALPKCTPTRAALMTGRYPLRYGLQTGVIHPDDAFGLALDERTLAQSLSEAGYRTAIAGKWHLGDFDAAYLPTRRGFDHQYGSYSGAIDYFSHERDGELDWFRDGQPLKEAGYATTLVADEAVRFLRDRERDRPFFLYVPFPGVHGPVHEVAEFDGLHAELPRGVRRQRASMIAALDDGVGRIARALRDEKIASDTLLVFASDNGGPGGPAFASDNHPWRGGKGSLYEGGVRVPAFASWPGRIESGTAVDEPLHMVDWYPTLLALAGAPLRQEKPVDGRDAWPAIAHGARSPHDEIVINVEADRGAIRRGNWKLIVTDSPTDARRWIELYDLAADPGEKKNLAQAEPQRVQMLQARLNALAREAVPAKRTSDHDD